MSEKETAAYYISSELKLLIAKEAKKIGVSESLLVETALANGIRETSRNFMRARKKGKFSKK
jgi:hypothetical protein